MNIDELKASGLIFYETIVGSIAYGTNTPESDIDTKGFYWIDPAEYLGLNPPVTQKHGQISDERNDNTYYSLFKAFELLKTANPNMIELLWMPSDCIRFSHPAIMPILFENRHNFITKQAYFSHAEYARNQIKKAKGKNKKVHNPQPEKRPVKEDFCRVILLENLDEPILRMISDETRLASNRQMPNEKNGWTYKGLYPFRPVPLKDTIIDLSKYHVASLEHAPNVYRLYYYGDGAKGVFRGDDMLVAESIPKEDEWKYIVGLLLYDQNEYEKAIRDWNSYWDWMKNRNEARWIDQEKGLLTYDAKNMCHCMRLMMASENILTIGEPTVRFEGEQLDFLMKIRRGEFEYEELMEKVDELDKRLRALYDVSKLPQEANMTALDKLYRHLMEVGKNEF